MLPGGNEQNPSNIIYRGFQGNEIEDLKKKELLDALKTGGKTIKKKKKINLLIAKKRKRKQPTTQIGEWLPGIFKKKLTELSEIQHHLESTYNVDPSEDLKRILSLLAKSKVVNNKITLSDNFANVPMYFYMKFPNLSCGTYSNDELYLAFRCRLLYNSLKNQEDNYLYRFLDNGVIRKVYYVSKSFVLKGKELKGFYQDYQGNFAAIGLESLGENKKEIEKSEEYKKIVSLSSNSAKFNYKSINYIAYYSDSAVVICKDNQDQNAIKNEMQSGISQLKVFKNTSAKTEISLKEVKHTKTKAYYADFRLKPEGFCPAFLLLSNNISVQEIYKMEFDLNALFKTLDDLYKEKNGFYFYDNLCYWDSINTFYDFLTIYALTSQEISEGSKQLLMTFVESFKNYKDEILLWKKLQLFGQKVIKDFYNCFTTYINYEKLDGISKRVKMYLDDFNKLKSSSYYGNVTNFLKDTKQFSQMMHDQVMSGNSYKLFTVMQKVLEDLQSGKRTSEMVSDLRKICLTIYKFSVCGDNCIFPIVVAEGAFLGDLRGSENYDDDLLKVIIEKYNEGLAVQKYEEGELRNMINDIRNNMDKYIQEVVMLNVKKFINENNYGLSGDNVNMAIKAVMDNLSRSQETKDALENEIINAKVKDKSLGSIVFQNAKMKEWVLAYIASLRNNQLVQNIQRNVSEIRNNNNYISNVNDNINVPSISSNVLLPNDILTSNKKEEISEAGSVSSTQQPANPPVRHKIRVNNYDGDDENEYDIPMIYPPGVPGGKTPGENTSSINLTIPKLADPNKIINEVPGGETPGGETPSGDKSKPRMDESVNIESNDDNDFVPVIEQIIPYPEQMPRPIIQTTDVDQIQKQLDNVNINYNIKPIDKQKAIKPQNMKQLNDVFKDVFGKKEKKKSQLDKELEKVNKHEKEIDKLLSKGGKVFKQNTVDKKFIKDDFNLDKVETNLTKRDSLFKKIVENNPYQTWSKQQNFIVDNLMLTQASLKTILKYYHDLLVWFYSLGIREVPKHFNTNEKLYNSLNQVDISDALLNELSKIIPGFGNTADLRKELLGVKTGKIFSDFKNRLKNLKNIRRVREYINIDKKYWPGYKEQSEAESTYNLGKSESSVNLTSDSQISGDTIQP